MAVERPDHTLQATALVNEAYMRLVNWKPMRWQNRAHFFAVSAQLMRRILVDFARTHQRQKRGAGQRSLSLEDVAVVSPGRGEDLVARSEELQSRFDLVCRLLLEKKKNKKLAPRYPH